MVLPELVRGFEEGVRVDKYWSALVETARSVLQMPWNRSSHDRWMGGVFAVRTSVIRRTSQGSGNFGPAAVTS